MKKTILVLMVVTSTLTLAMQSGLAQYRYTQGNYSFTVVDKAEFDGLGTDYDREVAFMKHTGAVDGILGQAGYDEYSYTQKDYSDTLTTGDGFAERMPRGMGVIGHVTGQSGYEEYKHIKGIK